MQSAINAGTENEVNLVDAQTLREMTITKEALFKRQKESVLDSLMSSMVKVASENGGNTFLATLNPQFDRTLLAEISSELVKLGYNVSTEDKTDPKLGPMIVLTVSW